MTWDDVAPLIGLYMGSFALGWVSGYIYLVFKKVSESVT